MFSRRATLSGLAIAPFAELSGGSGFPALELIASRADRTFYVRAGGDDERGDGVSEHTAFATPQRAIDSLPILAENSLTVDIGPGMYATSSRDPGSLDRPAVVYIDRIRAGKRTSQSKNGLTGAVVLKLAPGAVISAGRNGYSHGIYCTGHSGSIAIWGGRVEAGGRSEQLVTAHRGTYVHIRDTVIDGSGGAAIGLCAEGGGLMETVDVDATGSTVDLQTYAASFVQMAAPGGLHRVGNVGIAPDSGASLMMAMEVGGKLVNRGNCELNGLADGRRCVLAGGYDGRASVLHASRTDFTSRSAEAVTAECDTWLTGDLRFDCVLNLHGGAYVLSGSRSFTTGSRSPHQWPIRATAGTFVQRDGGIAWINSAGAKVGVNRLPASVQVARDGYAIPVMLNSGEYTLAQLENTKGSLVRNCVLDRLAAGAGGHPPDVGAEVVLCHLGRDGIEIVEGAKAIEGLPGGRITLGAGPGMAVAIRLVWLDDGEGGYWAFVGKAA